MRCPYLHTTVETIIQKPYRYEPLDVVDADETDNRLHLVANDTVTTTRRYFETCLEEECACFQDNQCTRR